MHSYVHVHSEVGGRDPLKKKKNEAGCWGGSLGGLHGACYDLLDGRQRLLPGDSLS